MQDLKYVVDGLKELSNLKKFELILCNLFRKKEDLNHLKDILKEIPNNLQCLELNLYNNQLGNDKENLKFLRVALRHLSNLPKLKLNLNYNDLG